MFASTSAVNRVIIRISGSGRRDNDGISCSTICTTEDGIIFTGNGNIVSIRTGIDVVRAADNCDLILTIITINVVRITIYRNTVIIVITMDSITSTSNRDLISTITSINRMTTSASNIKEIWIARTISRTR